MAERLAALRPAPERGNVVAAGAVALTTFVNVLSVRFAGEWGAGVHLVYSAAATVLVIAIAVASPLEEERPRAWQSALYVAAFALAFVTLTTVADVLGVDDPLDSPGTLVWIGLLLVLLTGWLASSRNSGVSTVLGAVALGVTAVAFVDWVFDPEGADTLRWILVVLTVAFGAAGASQREARPNHSLALVDVAGLATLVLALTFLTEGLFPAFGEEGGGGLEVGWGWELFMLAVAAALIAYAVLHRASGPGYLAAANLVAFAVLAGGPGADGASLIGWPLVLLVVTAALLALGLRREAEPYP